MTRTMQFTVGLLSGASLIALGAAGASADHFKRLSPKHTNYGVAQYNFAHVSCNTCSTCVTLNNPVHVDQIAAVLMYTRPTVEFTTVCLDPPCTVTADYDDYLTEVFLGCVVVEMTPNSDLGLKGTDSTDWPTENEIWPGCPGFDLQSGTDGMPRTAEVIWAPAEKVTVAGLPSPRRRADGLGGILRGSADERARAHSLMHPGLFSLPPDAGDAADAIECVCAGLGDLFADRDTFKPFGIDCP